MDYENIFDESVKYVKYVLEEVGEYKIYIYYNDYEEKKLKGDVLNNLIFPEQSYYMKDTPPAFAGQDNTLHIYYERTRFYGINADGTSHHFRLGALLPESVVVFFQKKYKYFHLMQNKRLESGQQNKVFFIELIIKEVKRESEE